MRWFKHLTSAHSDPATSAIIEEFGPDGYGIYWLLLEHFASAMEKDCKQVPSLIQTDLRWAQICHCSTRKLRKFTQRATELRLICCRTVAEVRSNCDRRVRNQLQIDIPKLLKYRDEYSRKSGHSPVSSSERDTDTEREQNRTKPEASVHDRARPRKTANGASAPPTVPDRFAEWWAEWQKIRGTNHHDAAMRAWLSVITTENVDACNACTTSYLQSIENPAKGYNPENFLFDQARDNFTARWPANSKHKPRVDTSYLDELEGKIQ